MFLRVLSSTLSDLDLCPSNEFTYIFRGISSTSANATVCTSSFDE